MMEWISVDDRLPEKYSQVLAFTDYGDTDSVYFFALDKTWGHPDKITHWMPLPAPPK
jgi:hypothetical protein